MPTSLPLGRWMSATNCPFLKTVTVPIDCDTHTDTAAVEAVMPASAE
jgi:hypothetical protein